jgi:hypothetical protein
MFQGEILIGHISNTDQKRYVIKQLTRYKVLVSSVNHNVRKYFNTCCVHMSYIQKKSIRKKVYILVCQTIFNYRVCNQSTQFLSATSCFLNVIENVNI